jgi:hypothetical protein
MAVYTDWLVSSLSDPNGLSNYIEVTEIKDSTDGYVFNAIPAPAAVDLNSDGKISLYELATWSERKPGSTKPGDLETTGYPTSGVDPAIAANGGTLGLKFTFKLMENTPDTMQGASCSINVDVIASQNIR